MRRWTEWLGVELNVVSTKEKAVATAGGMLSILLLCLVTEACVGIVDGSALVASMGASAVLLFAVPHGQLSQPWPVIAGHGLSALVGVGCADSVSVGASLAIVVPGSAVPGGAVSGGSVGSR